MLINISAEVISEAARLWEMLNTHQTTPWDAYRSGEFLNAVRKMLNILKDTPYEDHLKNELNDLKATLIASDEVINAMRQDLIEARKIQVALSNAPLHDHDHVCGHGHDHHHHHRTPDPETFSGEREKLREYVTKRRIKTQNMPDEQAKLRYAISTVSGLAFDQVAAFVDNNKVNIKDIAEFVTTLENAFGDVDRAATAASKMSTIRQGNREFSAYYAEFQRYAAELNWNEEAKLAALRRGLSIELKQDMILLIEEPDTVTKLVTTCQRLDQRRRKIQQDRRFQGTRPNTNTAPNTHSHNNHTTASSSSYHTHTKNTPSTTASGTHAGPMDLSAGRKKLTPEERAKRLAEGRCLYYGGVGHIAKSCPLAKAPLRVVGADTSVEINEAPVPLN